MPNRPSKEWWEKMVKEVKDDNPDYSQEQVDKTVGDIWYNKLSPSKKEDIIKSESFQPTALDRSLFLALHDDFKNTLKERVKEALTEEMQKMPNTDWNNIYPNVFTKTFEYLANIYAEALKSDMQQLLNTEQTEIKNQLVQEGFAKKTSKDKLFNVLSRRAKIKNLYTAFKTSFSSFEQEAATLSLQEVDELIKVLESLRNDNEKLVKKPLTTDDADKMQDMLNDKSIKPITSIKPEEACSTSSIGP